MVHSFQINFAYNPPKKYKGSCLDGRDITYKIFQMQILNFLLQLISKLEQKGDLKNLKLLKKK